MERAFFKVRLFFAAAINLAVHGAGDILFLTESEAKAHGHKLEPITPEQALALGVTEHTAANIVATVQGLPSDVVVKGLASGLIHEDTARAAFPDAFAPKAAIEDMAKAVLTAADPSKDEGAPGAAVEAAAAQASAVAEAATPAALDSTNAPAVKDEQASA
jgi:hypothetical protein